MSFPNIPEASNDGSNSTYIMVTGANAGLGFAICCRIIDQFLQIHPPSASLKLVITTRSEEKSNTTVKQLTAYLNRQTPRSGAKTLSSRVSFQSEQVNLTILRSVQALGRKLLTTLPKLDAIILNAGISGITGIHWLQAIWETLTDYIHAVTYPSYMINASGWTTKPQFSPSLKSPHLGEPPLGEVFCANVFGHYLLVHYLSPLLSSLITLPEHHGRIIWLSSIDAYSQTFTLDDLQGLASTTAYQSSKRLTDILALTASLPSTSPFASSFFSSPSINHPRMYTCHPGICATNILPLSLLAAYAKLLSFYIARWLGSPWHTATADKGACAPVWLALASQSSLDGVEEAAGQGKWGSSTDFQGYERARRTEVEGWGFGGKVGDWQVYGQGSRKRGAVDFTLEAREEFEELGRECWRQMENLRKEWEERLE